MNDEKYKLNNKLLTLPEGEADRLIAVGDGDAALLYIYLLRNGRERGRVEAGKALRMTDARLETAAALLRSMGLLAVGAGTPAPPPADETPEYTAEEVVSRSRTDSAFGGVLKEAESIMGRALSGVDMKTLFGIYDRLGLPPEVVLLLLHHCVEEYRGKYGPGRVPSMRYIEKEAYTWANREVLTLDAAESYLREQRERRESSAVIRRQLGIKDREPTPTERRYIDSWLELGFGAEAVETAMDRTVINTGQLKWNYMDKILRSWHDKGLHTPAEIQKGDPPGRRTAAAKPAAGDDGDDMEQIRRAYDRISGGKG